MSVNQANWQQTKATYNVGGFFFANYQKLWIEIPLSLWLIS